MRFEDKTVGIFYPPELELKSEIDKYVRDGGGFPRFRTNKGFSDDRTQIEKFDVVVTVNGFSEYEISKAYEKIGIEVVRYGVENKQEKVKEKSPKPTETVPSEPVKPKRTRRSKAVDME